MEKFELEIEALNLSLDKSIQFLSITAKKYSQLIDTVSDYSNAIKVLDYAREDFKALDKNLRSFLIEIIEISKRMKEEKMEKAVQIIRDEITQNLDNSKFEDTLKKVKKSIEDNFTFEKEFREKLTIKFPIEKYENQITLFYRNSLNPIFSFFSNSANTIINLLTQMWLTLVAFHFGSKKYITLYPRMETILDFINSSNRYLEKPLNLDWMTSTVYLTALDIVVNEKCKKNNVPKKVPSEKGKMRNIYFKEKVELLLKKTNVGKLETLLPSSFWKLRADVIHYGYPPNPSEVDIVIKGVDGLLNALSKI